MGRPGNGSTVGGRSTLCDRPLDARGLGDPVLAVLHRVRARVLVARAGQATGLVARAWQAMVLVARKRDARRSGVRMVHTQRIAVQRRHSRTAAVRKG
jgi:hypothetical protein